VRSSRAAGQANGDAHCSEEMLGEFAKKKKERKKKEEMLGALGKGMCLQKISGAARTEQTKRSFAALHVADKFDEMCVCVS
jgi:hypothetical protein